MGVKGGRDLSVLGYFWHPIPFFGRRIVDLGCNVGNIMDLAKEKKAKSYLGLDISKDFERYWNKKQTDESYKFEYRDLEKGLPFLEDSSADVVLCSFIFPYIRNKLSLFGEVVRILAPMGCAYFLNREYEGYTKIYRGWTNAFLIANRKNKKRIKRLKEVCEDREITYEKWRREKDPYIREFGKNLDEGIETQDPLKKFEILDLQLAAANFYLVFEKIAGSQKLKFAKSGAGMIMEKSHLFTKEDAAEVLARVKTANERYFMANINLAKQDTSRPLPTTLTVLDSRIIK